MKVCEACYISTQQKQLENGVSIEMAKAAVDTTTKARSPRGAKPVSQAFFTALETIPEASRAAVAKAAQAMIRDEMKVQREKLKAAAFKAKESKKVAATKKPAAAKASVKTVPAAMESKPKTLKPKAAKAKPAAKRAPRVPAEVPPVV